jgi:alpha-L-fucosidase
MSDKPEEKGPEQGATRRRFLKHMGVASVVATQPMHRLFAIGSGLRGIEDRYVPPRGNIRVPETDENWRVVKAFVTEPGPDYHHAPESAFEAFRDIKYGVRIHWGLYCLQNWWDTSWPFLKLSPAEKARYNEQYKTWNPSGFDPDAWMSFFRENGMKMFSFTPNHHEGFSMYDTKRRIRSRIDWASPDGPRLEECDLAYGIMETPFRRDIVREVIDAGRRNGLKIDLYFSHPNWYDADFRPYVRHPAQVPSSAELLAPIDLQRTQHQYGDHPLIVPDPTPAEGTRMMASHRQQLTELLSNYGKIDMVCFDMWLGKAVWPQLRDTMIALRKIQPDVMFRARGIGNYGDYYTPERFVPGDKSTTDMPWFVIYPLGRGWSWGGPDDHFKGSVWVIRNLADIVAKGGNFMVGIGPDPDGRFNPVALDQLKEVGAWLKVNGEALYGTRPRPGDLWKEGGDLIGAGSKTDNAPAQDLSGGNPPIRFSQTKDNRTIYVICLGWPGTTLPLKTVPTSQVRSVSMLGLRQPLRSHSDGANGLAIDLPADLQTETNRPCKTAWAFRLEMKTA